MIDARLAPFGLLLLYSLGVTLVAVLSPLSFTLTVVLLMLLPLIVLLQQEELAVLPLALMITLGVTLLLVIEAIAHSAGSWYSVAFSQVRWFSGVSFEAALFSILYTLYTIVIYEFFFDNRRLRGRAVTPTAVRGMVVFILLLCVCSGVALLLSLPYMLAVLISILLLCTLFVMVVSRPQSGRVLLEKILWFTVLFAPLAILIEFVAVALNVRLYAFSSDYIWVVNWIGDQVPLEELLLAILLPGLLVLLYELFVDDAR